MAESDNEDDVHLEFAALHPLVIGSELAAGLPWRLVLKTSGLPLGHALIGIAIARDARLPVALLLDANCRPAARVFGQYSLLAISFMITAA